jgi:hypothetical protein
MSSPSKFGAPSGRPDPRDVSAEEEEDLADRMAAVRREKREALGDPGPSWRDWFVYSAAKWYVVLGFLIILVWEVGLWDYPTRLSLGIVIPVVGASMYAEYLLYQYLWHRPPSASRSTRARHEWHSRWIHPVLYGRWTPEAADIRAGRAIPPPASGTDPREFL